MVRVSSKLDARAYVFAPLLLEGLLRRMESPPHTSPVQLRLSPHIAKWRETVKDWYAGERTGGRRGRNVWPPDNWAWSSGKPQR
jgi:hypothetical protein